MLAPGVVLFDKYRVDRMIGCGGMASVFSATHLHLNETVAIKVLQPDLAQNPTLVERFVREARAAVRLKGEHVTRVLDVGMLPAPWNVPYIVMELLVGIDLAELLKARGLLSPPEAVDIVLQVCEALAEAHVGGIVHRDIKPSNLFLTQRPDGSQLVKVLDFGISKLGFETMNDLTQGAIVGTPSYMSPEQLRSNPNIDARSDIWSLGVVLYRLLAGTRPFKADSISALAIQAATEPTPMLTIPLPLGLDLVVYHCLEKEVSLRFQSVAELAYALAPYAGDQRAAHIVIERTQNILRWTPPPPQPRPITSPIPKEPTTLGSSAGVVYEGSASIAAPPPRSRMWLIGGVSVTMIFAGVVLAVAIGGSGGNSKPTTTTTTPAKAVAPTPPTVEPIEPPSPSPSAVASPSPSPVETKPDEPKPDETVKVVKPRDKTKVSEPKIGDSKTKTVPKTKVEAKVVEPKKPVETAKPEEPKPTPKPSPKPSNPLDTRM